MPTRVAINGFGRVGRCAMRAAVEQGADIEFAAINDVTDAATLARLLAHDSVYGRFPGEVAASDGKIVVNGIEIPVFGETDPASLPWGALDVDVVIESTGRFRTREQAASHLTAGAGKVVISAPAKGSPGADVTVVLGVNDEIYDAERHDVISNASCTTNCLAPVAKAVHEAVGIEYGVMTTIHAYTGDQMLIDGPHKDPRRARSAAINLVPTSTGAAKAIGLVVPALEGRLQGIAVRAPVPTGSLVDLVFHASRDTTAEEINAAVAAVASTDRMRDILEYSEAPLVSTDVIGSSFSSVFDAGMTSVTAGRLVKVLAWYDNEWGYSARLIDLAQRL